jgi:predicted glutamine amidotransferase
MCKIIAITNAENILDMEAFARRMAWILSDQPDGYGWAAMGDDGQVFAQKTLYPMMFARNKKRKRDFLKAHTLELGVRQEKYKAAMFHGRVSTNVTDLPNTHPMVRDNTFLIHNGVVENIGEDYKKDTQNDSEDILYHYLKGGINGVAKGVAGYYACGVLNPADKTMRIIKDSTAPLVCAFSDVLDSWVFASNRKVMQFISDYIKEDLEVIDVEDNVHVIFDRNEVVDVENFVPAERWSKKVSSQSEKSIGKKVITHVDKVGSMDIDVPFRLEDHVSASYLEELEFMDESYTITTDGGREVGLDYFLKLPIANKLQHNVKRANGTIMDPWAFDESDSLYGVK